MKTIILIFFFLIFASLIRALVAMMQGDTSQKMVKSLAIRVILSIALVIFMVFANQMGWIQPNQFRP